jgi:hypothetical protein
MATHELPAAAIKRLIDLSTSHMTAKDATLCDELDIFGSSPEENLPRIIEHNYGYIIFVTSDPETMQTYLDGLRQAGFSEAFVDIYHRAATSENTIMMINFDRDAAPIDELPSFDW